MILLPKYRPVYAIITAGIFIVTGIMPASGIIHAINWNVLMMIAGTMILVYYFIESKMPNLLAEILLEKSKNILWVTIYLSLFAGIISAFIDNVATVLIVAPVALAICKKQKKDPTGIILSIAVSSNLQGAATLVGDTTSIMLGDYADMNFLDFFWMRGHPGIFFAVEFGALATVPVMMILFWKEQDTVCSKGRTAVQDFLPSMVLLLMIGLLIGASFLKNAPDMINGIICCMLALLQMLITAAREKNTSKITASLKNLDFETLILLTSLFLVIAGLTEAGIIDDFASIIIRYGSGSIFYLYTIVVWGSVLISAFVDNIPYVATMLPVLAVVSETLGYDPYLLFFGLLSGATLGGNLTPIGASANITAVGLLKKEGFEVSFKDFCKIGIPFTLTAVTIAYLYFWFLWA